MGLGMSFVFRTAMIPVVAATSLALAGCGPKTSATAPTSTPGFVDEQEAVASGCDDAVRPNATMKWYAAATPDDLRRCMGVQGVDHGELLYRAASPIFRDDDQASGVRTLLATGIDPNDSPFRSKPLTFWSSSGWRRLGTARSSEADEAVVRALLEAGADPNVLSDYPRVGVAKPILPVLKAARRNDPAGLPPAEAILRKSQEWRVLHAAIGSNRPTGSIAALLEHGADPNLTVAPGQDWTALHVAAFMGRPDVISLLLRHGADPHAVTSYRQWTALHALAEGGDGPGAAESGQLLLDAGIDPAIKDRKGRTAWDLVGQRFTPETLNEMAMSSPEVHAVIERLRRASS